MPRTIRPIGPVTATLQAAGYRQYAAIFEDGKQVPKVAVLSVKDGDKTKFVGHYIDSNGEIHKTHKFVDMKKAAARIMLIRTAMIDEIAAKPATKPIAKRSAPKRKPAARSTEPDTDRMCKKCTFLHLNDTPCP